jgi:F-type H+-transporting ATPase subunit epsilon
VPFQLAIVTPERLVMDESVDFVVMPGIEGDFGVLPDHTQFLSALRAGVVEFEAGGRRQYLAVSSGFAEVTGERVTLLARTAERADEIDRARAEAALARAREKIQGAGPSAHPDSHERMQAELDRAAARIATVER